MHETFHFRSLDDLRQRIAELSLDLQVADNIKPLLEPVNIGQTRLSNRLAVLPMEGCDGTTDGAPDELTFRRYRRFAAGGAGLLWMEATAVVGEGRANPRQLWIRESTLPSFAALADETRKAAAQALGLHHNPLLVLQLTHSGRHSHPGPSPKPIIAHHSPDLDARQNLSPDYPLISDEELERLEDQYVVAACCAHKAGFDAVDIKACHGYLISELHTSHTRKGSYGGSFENRSRFFRNIVAKIRAAVPGLLVTSRMNAYDGVAYPYGFGVDRSETAVFDPTEPTALVRYLESACAPLVNITVGNPYLNPHVSRPFDLPVAGGAIPSESPLEGVARFINIARRIQIDSPAMAVLGGGYSWLRQFFPNVAAASVSNGWTTLVGVGRMAFAYPDFARDLAEHGRLDPERVCVACSACTQIMRDGGKTGCVPRDSAIYEPIYKSCRAEALDTILERAKTCRQCNDPTCIRHCPARVDIPKFVGHIVAGQFRAAYETLREANALAAVCGYVCPAETLCEAGCINRHYSTTVPIRHLQRWISRKAVEEGWAAEPRTAATPSGKRVAVLGAGPAGVAAAATLAALGHAVTIFEGSGAAGGIAGDTIPAERLPDHIMTREMQDVLSSSGAGTFQQARLSSGYNLDHVMAERFDAVLIALGLTKSTQLPGVRPRQGVEGALEFLKRIKVGQKIVGDVLVLGGGNAAIDAAMAAKKAGASDVSIVYRRSFAEMPAWPAERDSAMRAGIHFLILTSPMTYIADSEGNLIALKVVRTRLGDAGADGRRVPLPIAGSEHLIPSDLIIEAIGQEVGEELNGALPGLRFTERGFLWTREGSLETSRRGVFAAGDIVNGGTTVVQAVAEGTRAACEIDAYLRSLHS